MWKHHASWIETLDGLPGFNLKEKARARVIILSKPREDRELYFQGTYAEVAAIIKALLSETPLGNLGASPGPTALRLTCCGDATPDQSSGSLRSSSTNVSSTSAPSSCASRRPSASELLVETASLVRHMSALPAAFRVAHFRASQPGDIFYRIVKDLLPASATTANITSGPGFERGMVEFAMVVAGVSPPYSTSSSGSSGSISASGSPCKTSSSEPGAVVAVRIRSLEVSRRRPARSDWPLVEYEAEVVPDPADTLEAVLERLDAGAVRAAEVLWWRKSPGKWALWNGTPQRSWCIVMSG
ncbi:hypothetical protein Vretimale_13550 [Volvox reticuliferus]|uniref:Uncharacterized protein n=1 Tax=Volvox reticuliferus TaxID=1737510 RepID=A0A8J4BV96_9CHLO|nr:hypothetical protein Vretifemale_460 [Volvox reticuliferus]GIM09813.1 hypothetical protein Vretimale_13550 [Volvox reticuliferus]